MARFHIFDGENSTIIEDAARKLGCKPTDIFAKAAIASGYIAYNKQTAIWLSRYVENRCIAEEVVDYCLNVLCPPKKALAGGL